MPRTRRKPERISETSRLRRLRDTLGMTQREMAVEFKVAQGAIAAWESGKHTIPGPALKLIELYEIEVGINSQDLGITRLKTSIASRNFALSKVLAAAVVQAAGSTLKKMLAKDSERGSIAMRTRGAIALNLIETLGDLKGVAMKIGQVLAFSDFAISDELRHDLTARLANSQPMSSALVTQVFLDELGQPPRQIFSEWCASPFAVASIGQVHRARLHTGEEVAVKVQYPAIIDAINADLRSAAPVERLLLLLFRDQDRGVFLTEMRERFMEECDYRLEAENQEEFRQLWRDHKGVRIPRVYRDLTTRKILVTEFVQGESLESFAEHASQEQKDRAGAIMWQFAIESIFRHRVINGDPNPGNYLFTNDEVIFLDFGCVKRMDAEFVACWRSLLRAALKRCPSEMRKGLLDMGITRNPTDFDFDHQFRLILRLNECYLRDGTFRFAPDHAQNRWHELTVTSPNRFRTNLPKNMLIANRLTWGLYAILARFGAMADFRTPILDLLYESHEIRPAPFTEAEMALLRIASDNL